MARTIIDIPDLQLREVDSLCRQLGISRAEAVRRALRDFLWHSDSARTDGFGLWRTGTAAQPAVRAAALEPGAPASRSRARKRRGP